MAEDDEKQEKRSTRGTVLCNRRVDGNYTMLPNNIVQSEIVNLSPEAFRLLAYVASRPETWELRTKPTAEHCSMGRDRVRNACNELEQHGLARFVEARETSGRIKLRQWEFTLTPYQWADPEEAAGDSHSLKFRVRQKASKSPQPENPAPEKPAPGNRPQQRTDSTKSKKKKRTLSAVGEISELVVMSVGAAAGHTASLPAPAQADSKTGSAMEEVVPRLWPFPDGADVTKHIKTTGLEPQAVWDQFREQKLKGRVSDNIRNLGGYLTNMARKMARNAYGPADPQSLAKARAALAARGNRR